MFSPVLRRLFAGLLSFVAVAFFSGRLAAELVWSAETGWRVEGGALANAGGADASNAISLMNTARGAEEAGRVHRALKYYKRVSKKYPNTIYAPEALYRAGKLRLARKQYSKAFDAFQAIINRHPATPHFNDIIGEQYRIAAALIDGARPRYWGLIPGFTNRTKAIEYFETILYNAPYSDYAPLALMSVAGAHQRFDNTEEAIDALDRMINNYPHSLLAPDAYLKLGQVHSSLVEGAYYDQGSTLEAITYFEDFMILFPSDHNVGSAEQGLTDMKKVFAESKVKIADFYFHKRDNYKAARVFYNEAITVYPDSEIAIKARERLAEVETAAQQAESGQPAKKRFFFF